MSWFVDKKLNFKKKENKCFLASNLVGFGSEWTLKLSVRCKFHTYAFSGVSQAVFSLPEGRPRWIPSRGR